MIVRKASLSKKNLQKLCLHGPSVDVSITSKCTFGDDVVRFSPLLLGGQIGEITTNTINQNGARRVISKRVPLDCPLTELME